MYATLKNLGRECSLFDSEIIYIYMNFTFCSNSLDLGSIPTEAVLFLIHSPF
jgi:hypothetical protein